MTPRGGVAPKKEGNKRSSRGRILFSEALSGRNVLLLRGGGGVCAGQPIQKRRFRKKISSKGAWEKKETPSPRNREKKRKMR